MTDKSVTTDQAVQNTDRELWREKEGDYYSPNLFVTSEGGIGMNVGGYCIVMPIKEWHKLAAPNGPPSILDVGTINEDWSPMAKRMEELRKKNQ
jgi:hypothetical protein